MTRGTHANVGSLACCVLKDMNNYECVGPGCAEEGEVDT